MPTSPNYIGKYISILTATEATGYNLQYLRRLLRAGKITGIKLGQVFPIEFASLEAYLKLKTNSVDKCCGLKKTEDSGLRIPILPHLAMQRDVVCLIDTGDARRVPKYLRIGQ